MPGQAEPTIAVMHVTVIDGTGAKPKVDQTVVVKGERITKVGKTSKVKLPAGITMLDGTGKFLIPGLSDMHVHWYDQDYLPLFIVNGVTSVRLMWGMPMHHEWRKEIEHESLPWPRLLIASAIVDGPKPIWPDSITVANETEGRKAVTQARHAGADFVKVYSLLSRDAYFAIADEAKRQGIPFAGHVPVSVSAEEASAAGQKSIEHLTGILQACSSHEAELLKSAQETLQAILTTTNSPLSMVAKEIQEDQMALKTYNPKKARAVFSEFKKNHTWQCPTLTVLRLATYADDPASFTNDVRLKYMPPEVRSRWGQLGNGSRMKSRTANDPEFARKLFKKEIEVVGAMHRAGVEILAGTDTLNPYCYPGFSLHDELGLLVQSGLTPMEALQAATLNAARFMGREKELGTIEPGKLADLVLLDADPLQDIHNTKTIRAVFANGHFFDRPALDKLLHDTEGISTQVTGSARHIGEMGYAKQHDNH
jgi:imidazolonepropionase-like amidohydrolase